MLKWENKSKIVAIQMEQCFGEALARPNGYYDRKNAEALNIYAYLPKIV